MRVLVMDDERANLEFVENLLKPAGFGVLKALGGQEVLKWRLRTSRA